MNLDEMENYGQDDSNFQDNSTGNQGQNTDLSSADHPFTDNAEPDYGNDLITEERTKEFDNENLGSGSNQEELDSEELDNELDTYDDNDELGSEKLNGEGLDDPEEEKQI
jgi:hypothetical protein